MFRTRVFSILLCLVMLLGLLSFGCGTKEDLSERTWGGPTVPPPGSTAPDPRPTYAALFRNWAFCITDGSAEKQGTRLKAIAYARNATFEKLTLAGGLYGQMPVSYQGEGKGDGKHLPYFPLYTGLTAPEFALKDKQASFGEGASAAFLVDKELLGNQILPLVSLFDPALDYGFPEASDEDLEHAQALAPNRVVEESRRLAQTDDGDRLCLFRYETLDKGRMVLMFLRADGRRTVYLEEVPTTQQGAYWRSDLEPEDLGYLEPLLACDTAEGLFLALAWYGPEGVGQLFLREIHGVLESFQFPGSYFSVEEAQFYFRDPDA